MAKQSKGQKYGRNRDRNPSSRLQAGRTAKNKAKRAQPKNLGAPSPDYPYHALTGRNKAGNWLYATLCINGMRERVYCT